MRLVFATMQVWVLLRTMRRLCDSTALQRLRGLHQLSSTWASCLTTVKVLRRTMWKQRDSTVLQRLRGMHKLSSTWASCLTTVKVFRRTMRRLCDSGALQRNRGMQWLGACWATLGVARRHVPQHRCRRRLRFRALLLLHMSLACPNKNSPANAHRQRAACSRLQPSQPQTFGIKLHEARWLILLRCRRQPIAADWLPGQTATRHVSEMALGAMTIFNF